MAIDSDSPNLSPTVGRKRRRKKRGEGEKETGEGEVITIFLSRRLGI